MEFETCKSNEIYVVLEGLNINAMRYVCLHRDLNEALNFVKETVFQLQKRLKAEAKTVIELQRRNVGHCVRLLTISDNTIVSQYVVQKTPIL